MKTAIAILVALACFYAFTSQKRDFDDNLNEFFELIDLEIADKLREVRSLYERDEKFKKALSFLESDRFVNMVEEIEVVEEYVELTKYLSEANVDLKLTVIKIYKFLTEFTAETSETDKTEVPEETNGFIGYFNDILAILPQDKIETVFNDKMENDFEFKSAVDLLTADKFDQLVNSLISKRPILRAAITLQANGIPIVKIKNTFLAVFGIS